MNFTMRSKTSRVNYNWGKWYYSIVNVIHWIVLHHIESLTSVFLENQSSDLSCLPSPYLKQELLAMPEFNLVFSWVRVTRSLVLYACFFRSLLVLFLFSHCVVCSSSIYGLWLPLCYLQTILKSYRFKWTWATIQHYT